MHHDLITNTPSWHTALLRLSDEDYLISIDDFHRLSKGILVFNDLYTLDLLFLLTGFKDGTCLSNKMHQYNILARSILACSFSC